MKKKTSGDLGRARAMRLALYSLIAWSAGAASPSRADDGEVCKRARLLLDEPLEGATEAACQQALDTAEEDKWQLWLDVATALELTKDSERSVQMLQRFVTAADKRGARISERWANSRDEARAKVKAVETELMKTKGRVTITTVPEGAEVTVLGNVRPGPADKTPVTRYLPAGTHVARVVGSKDTREISFPIAVGQRVDVQVDLREGGVSTVSVDGKPVGREAVALAEKAAGDAAETGKAGDAAETGKAGDAETLDGAATSVAEGPVEPLDSALLTGGVGLWTRLGTASISVGAAAVAVGLVFALQASGLDDEAACSGDLCGVDAPLRTLVRADADTSWTRATGAFIAGGALLAGGIVAVLMDPEPARATVTPQTHVTPWLGPDGAGLVGQLRF
jgi:hypothetical protein